MAESLPLLPAQVKDLQGSQAVPVVTWASAPLPAQRLKEGTQITSSLYFAVL